MAYLTRLAIVLGLFALTPATSSAQLSGALDTEVRAVLADRVILPGGRQLPVLFRQNEGYGPLLDNYPMLVRVGYIDLARLHLVQGVVVQVDVIVMHQ